MIKKISLILNFFIILSCQTIPNGYEENLTISPWINTETINTPAGEAVINSTSTFSTDGIYNISIDHPVNGISRKTFFYKVGYYQPKYAIILYEFNDNIGFNPPVIGTPIFYYFKDDSNTLITSTNSNMALYQKWHK